MTAAIKQPLKTLPGVITRSKWLPPKVCIYGDSGIGKSTFGSSAPNPIFINTEAGVENLDVARFPVAETLEQFVANLDAVATGDHDYKTVVIDTLNGLMHLFHKAKKDIRNDRGKPAFDFVNFGGHSGWGSVANDIQTEIFPKLSQCQQRGMFIIILAHAGTYSDKTSVDDVLKTGASINKMVWKVVLGEMDVVGKAEYVYTISQTAGTVIKASTNEEVVNGVRVKQRRLVFEGGMEVDAKTRIGYELPPEMPLSWAMFEDSLGNVDKLAVEVRNLWQYIEPGKEEATLKWFGVDSLEQLATANRSKLSQIRNRLLERKSQVQAEEQIEEEKDNANG